ncbi:MAG: lytic transglycosylase domain-containing protein [Acidobacteriota bacterium]
MSIFSKSRAPRVALATTLFLVVSFNSPPSIPSVPENQPAPPSPEEIYLLEQVAEWVLGQPLTSDFRAFSDEDVVSAVQASPQSFELFRSYAEDASRRDLLEELPYGGVIADVAARHQVDGLLVASIMETESGFDSSAVSPQGALGLMQVMPTTASVYPVEDLLKPELNIELGTRYFVSLLEEFDGDVALALAGYNAGPGSVKRFGGMPPYRETRLYVDRVLTKYVHHQRDLWHLSGDRNMLF